MHILEAKRELFYFYPPSKTPCKAPKAFRMNLRSLLSISLMLLTLNLAAQEAAEEAPKEKKEKEAKEPREKKPRPEFYDHKLPSIYVGGGQLSLLADDISKGLKPYNSTNWRWGMYAGLEHRTWSALGFSLGFMYGQLSDNERSPISYENRNVETTFMQLDLHIKVYLDNNLFINRASKFSPYLFGGVGYILNFTPKADLLDAEGRQYHYWEDGRIMDRPKSPEDLGQARPLEMDRKYETELTESYTSDGTPGQTYSKNAITFPFGIGLRYKFSNAFYADIKATYHWTLTDYLDNYKNGSQTDHYIFTSVGVGYNIAAKKPKKEPTQFDAIDFLALENGDDDGDGVKNINDLCAGTPAGVKVDEFGCPKDGDKDGVPDYRDLEGNSAADAIVNRQGVTIDEDALQRDTVAVNRDVRYLAFPSIQGKPAKSLYSTDEPETYRRASSLGDFAVVDRDGDGFISADEITWAIDAFFEGELDFNANKLHDLIDFFFEQ